MEPLDLRGVRTHSLRERRSKVHHEQLWRGNLEDRTLGGFLRSLPRVLFGADFREVVERLSRARLRGRPVILGMGAHVIKVGLGPLVVEMMRRRLVTALAMNGAGAIHDLELAMVGQTSEDVAEGLARGSFGMARETAEFINQAVRRGASRGMGLGAALGAAALEAKLPFGHLSVVAQAAGLGIPLTVHVAIGTDVIHMHPSFDGAAFGAASHRDFRLLAALVARLEGGAYLNVGSAVVLPEVFLKALNLARNLGHRVEDFTAVVMDFLSPYRALVNVAQRPGGRGFHLQGPHELLLPLLAHALVLRLEEEGAGAGPR